LLAVKTAQLYEANTNNPHPRLPLLRRFLQYFLCKHFVLPNVLEYVLLTAERLVAQAAHHNCFQQSSSQLFAGTCPGSMQHGGFLSHALECDSEYIQEVLHFGWRAVQFLTHF
jgi:hypothetical protein